MLFRKASKEEWIKTQDILSIYEKWSDQILDREKFFIMFSQNTKARRKELVIQATWSIICGSYQKYLGLPAMVGRSKTNTCRSIKEKIWKRITSRNNYFLSQVGREILIKVLLQALPVYTMMSVFRLPRVGLKKSFGWVGLIWATLNGMVGWVSETLRTLILLCLPKNYGEFFLGLILLQLSSWKKNISDIVNSRGHCLRRIFLDLKKSGLS